MEQCQLKDILNKIIQENTLDVLKNIPDNCIDIGVTSPPYNKGENKKGWLVKNVKYHNISDKMPEEEYQQNQIEVLNELYRIIKPDGSFFYNHKIRWEKGEMLHPMEWLRKSRWSIRQEIIWDRMIAANIRGWRFWQVDERIYWLYKPINNNLIGKELEPKHALLTSIWRFPPERENPHPAPFPLELPLRCIYSILNEQKSAIVIDPYSGSGTTLLAAKLLGYNYIGIEISDEYIKLAQDRLKNFSNQKDAFQKEMDKHIVNKTFKDRKKKGEYTGKFNPNLNTPTLF